MINTKPMKNKWISFFIWYALILFIQGISSYVTMGSVKDWYPTLEKPNWNPPDWVFGPVWTVLYFMLAVSIWLVWNSKSHPRVFKKWGIVFFSLQLFFNFLWSIFFFGLHEIALAALDLILIIFTTLITIYCFWRVHRVAALLLFPYLIWLCYAASLNIAIVWLN